jgi:hypothetical protein
MFSFRARTLFRGDMVSVSITHNRVLDLLYALTRIACIETICAFLVATETRYVASAQISATVKILLQKPD